MRGRKGPVKAYVQRDREGWTHIYFHTYRYFLFFGKWVCLYTAYEVRNGRHPVFEGLEGACSGRLPVRSSPSVLRGSSKTSSPQNAI
jgi:hypothetical protein